LKTTLAEIHIERAQQRNLAGNIYKGRVARVLPGMQAAFVEVGLESRFHSRIGSVWRPSSSGFFEDDENEDAALDDIPEEDQIEAGQEPESEGKRAGGPNRRGRRERFIPHVPLEERIKKNQEILVQVTKEPIGTKGCRLTSHISLPGRHLVYTPTVSHIGVSRRIADSKERKRLRDIVQELRPPDGGFIVRTACED
jgi:ribonuclease G